MYKRFYNELCFKIKYKYLRKSSFRVYQKTILYIYIITKIPFFLETYTQTTSKKEKINHYLLLGEYLPLSKAKPTNIRRLKNTFLLNARAYK
jgi:hypothetical protein